MTINGRFTRDDVDPQFIGQILASYRGENAQMRRIIGDLQILRERQNWGDKEWDQVYRLHREMDTVKKRIAELRERLRQAGVQVT